MQTGRRHETGDGGFMMVALLVGMAVAAVYLSAALPAWRQQAQREKEEELIFRGRQYARALMLYQEKNRNANPPDIDVLVSQHFLRKKWKDPVTGEDFVPLGVGIGTPGSGSQSGTSSQGQTGGGQPLSNQNPGVSGVRSKSTATSIKIYQQQQQHSMWQFNGLTARQQSGRTPPQQPGQPGQPPSRGGPGAGAPGNPGPPRGGGPPGPGGSAGPPGAPPPGSGSVPPRVGGS
jgi:type II secretory pathway pseudopilin PulG